MQVTCDGELSYYWGFNKFTITKSLVEFANKSGAGFVVCKIKQTEEVN